MHECSAKRIKFPEFSYMIPHSASKNNGFSLGNYGNRVVSWVGYADDIALAFENISDMNNGLEIPNIQTLPVKYKCFENQNDDI